MFYLPALLKHFKMGLKDSDKRQLAQLNNWQYIIYLQKLCVHSEPLGAVKQDMFVLIHFIFSGLRIFMVHRSPHVQELNLLNLKATWCFRLDPWTSLESSGYTTGRQILWKHLQEASPKGKHFFSLPSSDSYPCSCWWLWTALANQWKVKLLEHEAKLFIIHHRSQKQDLEVTLLGSYPYIYYFKQS